MHRFCWGLAALLAAVGLSTAVQFGLVTGRHPSSPLLEVPGSSRVLCAIRCLTDTSCVSWEVTGSGCSLYRGVTSDPTATTSSGPLWADLWIPDGYQMVPGTNRAFRAHTEVRAGALNIPNICAQDHPKAAPAFLENEEQVRFAQGLINITVWTGVKEISPDVYGDFVGSRTVTLMSEWFAPAFGFSFGDPCLRLRTGGLDLNGCSDEHGHLCEYELFG